MIINNVNEKIRLKSAELFKDDELETHYLKLIYEVECKQGIKEITFPKVSLMIPHMTIELNYESMIGVTIPSLMFGYEPHQLLEDESGSYMYERLIEENIHDMTLDEIEKELGYKVRIVGKKQKSIKQKNEEGEKRNEKI